MNLDYKNLGLKIRQYRNDKGLSQERLADEIFITSNHLSRIELGTRYPSLEVIVSIANTLNVSIDDLLSDSLKSGLFSANQEASSLLLDCTVEEKDFLLKTLQFLKDLLIEHGI